jgi:hypothetical protein
MTGAGTHSDALGDGDRVLYFPVLGGRRCYEGVVRGAPYQVASGHWLVAVEGLPDAYCADMGTSRRSVRAWVEAVRKVEPCRENT